LSAGPRLARRQTPRLSKMKAQLLWKLSVTTTASAEEGVSGLFERLFNLPASSYTDAATGKVFVAVYPSVRPQDFRTRLEQGLADLRRCGVKIGRGSISCCRIARRDWAESWKRHFKPLGVGSRLLVRPPWSRRRARRGQRVVVLNPGLSFGTGQHPTTGFCLGQLAARRHQPANQSFLDLGTGSGILAIAAAKLGYRPVDAVDTDPMAIRTAAVNARRNGVSAKVNLRQCDIARSSPGSWHRYDLVCANLHTPLLLAACDRIAAWLSRTGVLVLAGILKSEFAAVQSRYRRAGLELTASRSEGEWRSGTFVFRGRARATPIQRHHRRTG
jgi:ribosomal protein L11 methyltransferase